MKRFTTFKIEDQWFGLDVLLVREINQHLEITPVQTAAEYIRGLINLRGQIVTIMDLGKRLGLGDHQTGDDSHVIVLKTNEELAHLRAGAEADALKTTSDPVGLLVGAIGNVIECDEADIEAAPANVGGVSARFLSGVIKLESDLVVLLHIAIIVNQEPGQK
ncbi:MAG TPA: hypothetical protein ENN65_06355 [Candidatus Hydrogenedentes bacterium]|nr:hypothetical protein [Candidatus Hydrogenedentota bacterium]